jgi:hypothetical protein
MFGIIGQPDGVLGRRRLLVAGSATVGGLRVGWRRILHAFVATFRFFVRGIHLRGISFRKAKEKSFTVGLALIY